MKAYFGKKRFRQIHSATHGAAGWQLPYPSYRRKGEERPGRMQPRKAVVAG